MQTVYDMLLGPVTAAASVWYEEQRGLIPIPDQFHDEPFPINFDYHDRFNAEPYYFALSKADEILEQLHILNQFSLQLIRQTREIDPQIARIVNENFWDLL